MEKYKRILLKLSGEALGGKTSILDKSTLVNLLNQIKILQSKYKLEIGIVVGGGNIFRGQISNDLGLGKDTAPADYMGMLATSINALGLKTFFNNHGLKTIMQNSLYFENIADVIDPKEAIKHLEDGYVVIFGGGTGTPYLSTDTAAAMRAIDIKADGVLMAKNGVDGVYTSDPKMSSRAKFIENITFSEIIEKKLKVADIKAMELLKNEKIDIIVFNMNTSNNIINLYGDNHTRKTIISEEK